ncbi:MAG: Asp-tRNA(Asn)/Glu-tRNA(Gln) amidotransferase GatCAB subunit A [Candidatus Moranbacteria bacterium CG23_combo_of_CG06-09_8_20_14_all_39_10]|nr:MAG: Asp-tRNA(Asn)/Glu-tRNA(Gln) amidotransferase GatCAB subunit A [Candidatus Moranbacteria bacterium CG23_combo_of_CG06-09_8_20_14_all_39_10]
MIRDLHEKLINKEISAVQLAEEYFARIEEKDKNVFAFLTLTKELAMAQARAVDAKIAAGEEIGILEGIPGAIKDNLCVAGVRATAASKILDNYIAPYDATVIKNLQEAGAIILGKTNMDEFAMGSSTEHSAYGPTKNPADTERVPGGSSGGSAAAVAASEAVWALGTDTGGSIRQPVSFCGVVGLKPTYGRVSRYGAIAMASSLDQIGPITKTVEDAAIILSTISGEDKMDGTSAQSPAKDYTKYLTGEVVGLKIGIVKEYLAGLNDQGRESIEKVIEIYKKLGAEMVEIELPYAKYALPVYYIIMPCEVSSNLARFDGIKYGMRAEDHKDTVLDVVPEDRTLIETYLDSRKYGLGAEVKKRIMLGTYALSSGYYDAYYLRAQKVRTLIKKDFEKAFETVDLILTPTTPSPAFKIGEKTEDPLEMYLADVFTITANIVGVPAISVPGPKVDNLPFGFQLMGKWFDEENLLRAAHAYETSFK